MSQSKSNAAETKVPKINITEFENDKATSPMDQEKRPRSSVSTESLRLVKRPKTSRNTSIQPTQSAAVSASSLPRNPAGKDESVEDSSLHVGQTNTSWYLGYSFDHTTENTSLAEDEDPQTDTLDPESDTSCEHLLFKMDADFAQIGSFVADEEGMTQALLVAPDEVLEDVVARLEGILKEAETVLSKLKSALERPDPSRQ